MCPADGAHLTLEFPDHYLIKHSIKLFSGNIDYSCNALGETGAPVEDEFEYTSGNNPHFLTVPEIRAINRKLGF